MQGNEIVRDTRNYYLDNESLVSKMLINFALKYAGNKILDVGCATGDYCNELKKLDFKCTGIDINAKYINKAKENGIDAYTMDAKNIDFPDNSFDTVLLFEVLEHVDDPLVILNEVKRVAKKNILITVPNCNEFSELKKFGLTYEHMLEKDHINFFTINNLDELLSKKFIKYKILEREPIALGAVDLPWILKYPIWLLYKLKLIKSNFYYRLYAVVEVN
ncbi:class I SAM-dependent methyltransferase [Methanobacterium sp. ACI-7]|uniref:class I SAM-dependent methyltransferase n=1 Tax=unclassified Methanobacterium TaxID=2627676 RepID=UPI0039C121D7